METYQMKLPKKPLEFRAPMLAHEFIGRESQIQYPCYVQPKLDGVRCITDGQRFWSRNGKLFPQGNFKHLRQHPFPFLVDGELSLYGGQYDFEDIVSIVKRAGHPRAKDLMFCAFDVMTDKPFVARKNQLQQLFQDWAFRVRDDHWQRVTTKKVNNIIGLQDQHLLYLDFGNEGTMIRSAFGLYVPKRTIDLLKWKPLKSEEFEIVEVIEANGKDAGTPVFVCIAGPKNVDARFKARPMGTEKQRRKMWRERKKLIGKMLTVEFQNYTKYGVPRFPRAKVLRDYE